MTENEMKDLIVAQAARLMELEKALKAANETSDFYFGYYLKSTAAETVAAKSTLTIKTEVTV